MPLAPSRCARGALGVGLRATGLAGCSLFDWGEDGRMVSVFELAVGDCVISPSDVQTELSELRKVDCAEEHHMEVFARVAFPVEETPEEIPPFPGDSAMKAFSDGACAEEFHSYVGVDFRDSELWTTYLAPSARSWSEGEDRTVTCFVTTTGGPLTGSVAGSQR